MNPFLRQKEFMVRGSVSLATVLGRREKLYPSLLRGSSQVFLLVYRHVGDRADHNFHSSECFDQSGRLVVVDRGVLEALRFPVQVTGVLLNKTNKCPARGACDGRRTERVTRVTDDTAPSAFNLGNSSMTNFPMFPAPMTAKLV